MTQSKHTLLLTASAVFFVVALFFYFGSINFSSSNSEVLGARENAQATTVITEIENETEETPTRQLTTKPSQNTAKSQEGPGFPGLEVPSESDITQNSSPVSTLPPEDTETSQEPEIQPTLPERDEEVDENKSGEEEITEIGEDPYGNGGYTPEDKDRLEECLTKANSGTLHEDPECQNYLYDNTRDPGDV